LGERWCRFRPLSAAEIKRSRISGNIDPSFAERAERLGARRDGKIYAAALLMASRLQPEQHPDIEPLARLHPGLVRRRE